MLGWAFADMRRPRTACPLHRRKRTSEPVGVTSALGQKRSFVCQCVYPTSVGNVAFGPAGLDLSKKPGFTDFGAFSLFFRYTAPSFMACRGDCPASRPDGIPANPQGD
jgi:hypothetical protein